LEDLAVYTVDEFQGMTDVGGRVMVVCSAELSIVACEYGGIGMELYILL
jgi:hypothetical protein